MQLLLNDPRPTINGGAIFTGEASELPGGALKAGLNFRSTGVGNKVHSLQSITEHDISSQENEGPVVTSNSLDVTVIILTHFLFFITEICNQTNKYAFDIEKLRTILIFR